MKRKYIFFMFFMLIASCEGMYSIHSSRREMKEVAALDPKFNDLIATQIVFIIDACKSKLDVCGDDLSVNYWCISCLYLYNQLMKNPIYCDSERLKQALYEVRQLHEASKNFSPKTVVVLNKKRKNLDKEKKFKAKKRIKEDAVKKKQNLKSLYVDGLIKKFPFRLHMIILIRLKFLKEQKNIHVSLMNAPSAMKKKWSLFAIG